MWPTPWSGIAASPSWSSGRWRTERPSPPLDSSISWCHWTAPSVGEKILEPAVELGKAMGSRFTLLHVVAPHVTMGARVSPLPAGRLKERLGKAEEYLSGVAERLEGEGIEVEVMIESHFAPARAILNTAEAQGRRPHRHRHPRLYRREAGAPGERNRQGAQGGEMAPPPGSARGDGLRESEQSRYTPAKKTHPGCSPAYSCSPPRPFSGGR